MNQHCRNIVITILFSIFLMVFIGGCVTGVTDEQRALDAGMKPLDDQELQSLFSNRFQASFISSQRVGSSVVRYNPNGKFTSINSGISKKGSWRIANGELCTREDFNNTGTELCTTWIKIAEDKYNIYFRNQRQSGVLTIINLQ
jgi:hypothetical protein